MDDQSGKRVLAQFKNEEGELVGFPFDAPVEASHESLSLLCNAILGNDEDTPYEFFVHHVAVQKSLSEAIAAAGDHMDQEKVLEILYQPQALFRVRAVSRCSSSMPGHSESVIKVAFSPDGRHLASGSGDTTVRLWDLCTETPQHSCSAHKNWVLFLAWSPNGRKLASGCMNGKVCLWDPQSGQQIGKTLTGHQQWISWLSWQPLHLDPESRLLASASKDSTIRIWDTSLGRVAMVLSGHAQCVTCIRWGGEGLLYSSSRDRTIKVWRAADGTLCRSLSGHGHWVNTLSLHTDYVLRTGAYEPGDSSLQYRGLEGMATEELQSRALERYKTAKGSGPERMVSGSDDSTLFLWKPSEGKRHIERMTGHQQPINEVCYSPNGRMIASASYDKSVKLWDGLTGRFIATLRGHVERVYQVSWSSDSRLLCSGSCDSTLKVWETKTFKILVDLPGHADEVFSVDWSPDGERVASGGRDRVLKIWRR